MSRLWSKENKDGSTSELTIISHWYGGEIYLLPTFRITRRFGGAKRISFTFFFLGYRVLFHFDKTWTADNFAKHIKDKKDES